MTKTQINCLIILALCSTIMDYMISGKTEIVYPRDRFVHIIISVLITLLFIYLFGNIDFSKGLYIYIASFLLTGKTVYTMYNFIQYFHMFHGSNISSLVMFTGLTILMAYKSELKRISHMQTFFIICNAVLILMIIILGKDKLNAANIYSNNINIRLSFSKLYVFFETFTLAVIIPKGNKMYNFNNKK